MPESSKLNMVCRKCRHEWEEVFPLPMISTAFGKRIRGLCCPSCAVGFKSLDVKTTTPTQERAS